MGENTIAHCLLCVLVMMLRLLALTVGIAASMELTKDTWESATAGKSVFVKFQAPW